MSYKRVVPRDLFNEAKLLNNLGRLQILIDDRNVGNLPLIVDYDGEPFQIEQDPNSGALYCVNFTVWLDGDEVNLSCPYNDKEKWTLIANYRGEEYYCFDPSGNFSPNFAHPDYKFGVKL